MNADAVQAAAAAIHRTPLSPDNEQSRHMPPDPSGWEERAAANAVAAAEPIIRAQIAAEIEAARDGGERRSALTSEWTGFVSAGMSHAANVVRGGAS